ncbi:aspartate kinase [uncultured Psychroserpens sp.]|uniref:aspartate kinase n=1 Tax=uncultured Psychroserpens sp. TaxID=255436 RepID=UPI00260A9498|nr:aspartate kinase [uncultured Psychroserpens sp.]
MSNPKTIHLVIFGIGNVGSTLINQINASKQRLKEQLNLTVEIPVVTNSKLVFFNGNKDTHTWETNFEKFSVPFNVTEIIQYIKEQHYKHVIAIDATSGEDLVKSYVSLIENGFHIVSANKLANTLHYDFYERLRLSLKKHNRSFLYETNVGAGLPIIETIKQLYDSGEQIEKIRGVFSGSLSYVFNRFSAENEPFSKVLSKASNLGLTEPDARDDLSGHDVARKLLILARELDLNVEFQNVKIESLVPKQLNGKTTLHQFKTRIKELDQPFLKRKQALSQCEVLRYVGELNVAKKVLEVKLISEDKQSALGQLKGADSIFEIFTKSYGEQPLVIQGAGAGKAVTARGLLSDVVKLSKHLN